MADTFESLCAPTTGNVSQGLMALLRETGLDGTQLTLLANAGTVDPLFVTKQIITLGFNTIPNFYFQAIALTDFDSKVGPTAALVEAQIRTVYLIDTSDQSWSSATTAVRNAAFQNLLGRFKRCYMKAGQIYTGDKEEPLDDVPMSTAARASYKVKYFAKYGHNIPSMFLPRDTLLNKFDKSVHIHYVHIPLNTLVSSASQESSSNGTFISDTGQSRRIAGSSKKAVVSFPQLQTLQQMYCNAYVLIGTGMVTADGKPYFDMAHKQRYDHFMQQNAEKWSKAPASFHNHLNANFLSVVDTVNDSEGHKGAGDAVDLALNLRQAVILAGPTEQDLCDCGNTPPGSGKRNLENMYERGKGKYGDKGKGGQDKSKGSFPGLKTSGPTVLVDGKKACKFYNDNRTCRNTEATCKDGHFCDVMLPDGNGLKVCGEKHTRKQHVESHGGVPKYT